MNLLHIDSSIQGDESISRDLTARVVDRVRAGSPGLSIVYRDLASNPLGGLESSEFASIAENEALAEFLASDIIVIGAPTYNFTIASQLKEWIDRIVVAGKTFAYTETGAAGLAGGKRIIVVNSRGGVYSGDSPYKFAEHAASYLREILGFIGVTDLEFIIAEGIRVSPELRETAVAGARAATETVQLSLA